MLYMSCLVDVIYNPGFFAEPVEASKINDRLLMAELMRNINVPILN